MDEKQTKEAKDAITKATIIPDGKCAACHYSEMIHEGIISHISPFPAHTCKPGPNATDNAKVREIADELISILYPESITDSYGLPYSKEKLKKQADRKLQICLPAARAMTAKMKEEFSEGYHAAMKDQGLSGYESDPDLKQHLIKRGLIPAKPENNER